MTHNYRASIIVPSISKSVEPNEEQKENDKRFSVRYSLQALKLSVTDSFVSCHGYHALLVLGKDIPLKYVFKHIFNSIGLFNLIIVFFLSIVLFNLSGNLT